MEAVAHYLSGHPMAIVLLIAVCIVILYFIFKQLIKMAILFVLILMAMAGYFYFKGTKSVHEAYEKTKVQTQQVVETGKDVYQKGKDIYEKGKKITGSSEKDVDKKEGDKKEGDKKERSRAKE